MIQHKVETIHAELDNLNKLVSELKTNLSPVLIRQDEKLATALTGKALEAQESDIATQLNGAINRIFDLKAAVNELVFGVDLVDRAPTQFNATASVMRR